MDSLRVGAGASHAPPLSCFEEPLWRGIPVCTVNCPGYHRSDCPDYQSATSEFDRSARLALSNACIDFIKYRIGGNWCDFAVSLGFSGREIRWLKRKYISKKQVSDEVRRVKIPGSVFLVEDLLRKAVTQKGLSAEAIFAALEEYGMKHAILTDINNQIFSPVDLSFAQSGRFESYIFLIWIKKDRKSLALPNTSGCPVMQRCYDWANHNPNKLVVLWFSSSMLDDSSDDHDQLLHFQQRSISEGITNLLILDIDNIHWGGEKRLDSFDSEEMMLISDALRFDGKHKFVGVIDRLRPVLLSKGSEYIKSAMKTRYISPADIPERGAYFDVDYIPVPFRTFCERCLCRDRAFDKMVFDGKGVLRIRGMMPNSFLAVSEEGHKAIMNFPIKDPYLNLGTYARRYPHLVATTKAFRMSDCHYKDDGTLLKWKRETSWEKTYRDRSAICPLSPAVPPVPEYLATFKKTPDGMVDPMINL